MDNNENLKESTKKFLFEQHSSDGRAYSSQQDGLDKAFTTILFAEIAFYISRIDPLDGIFWLDLIAVAFIAFSLFIVFLSFIRGKATLTIHRELLEKQIYAIDFDLPEEKEELLQIIEEDTQLYDKSSYILSQLNRHIPAMIFASTGLCFFKVSLTTINYKIYLILFLLYIIMGTGTFIYTWCKKNENK